MSYPETLEEKAALYFKAVHEIRARLRTVENLLEGDLAPLLVEEFCQLQLRLSCECLAIACLAAQGDFETHKAFSERYEPGAIFKALEAIYPEFFPTPSIMHPNGPGAWHFDDVGHGHCITRGDVEQLWNLSGGHLHRGSVKRYLQDVKQVDLLGVAETKERFWNLLLDHMIVLADKVSRLHVHVERDGEGIFCNFLFLELENGTSKVQAFQVAVESE